MLGGSWLPYDTKDAEICMTRREVEQANGHRVILALASFARASRNTSYGAVVNLANHTVLSQKLRLGSAQPYLVSKRQERSVDTAGGC